MKKLKSFQSHYGLILSRVGGKPRGQAEEAFNPTMVWFYLCGVVRSYNKTRTASFQSHYGLILSRLGIYRRKRHNRLSIPLWSDFISQASLRMLSCRLAFNPTMVWFYRTVVRIALNKYLTFNPTMVWFYLPLWELVSSPLSRLSIPLWSDFIRAKLFKFLSKLKYFQSHYGLILSVGRALVL